jgi:hypothetical protein
MKKWRLFGKIAVLACSVLLLGGYVFVRAGGRLWPAASDNPPPVQLSPEQERIFFSGSKSLQLGPAVSVQPQADAPQSESPEEAARRTLIMAGSKSAAVFEPASEPTAAAATPPNAAPTAPQRSVIMGGSKSEVIVLPPPQPQPPQNTVQNPAAQSAPSQRSQP